MSTFTDTNFLITLAALDLGVIPPKDSNGVKTDVKSILKSLPPDEKRKAVRKWRKLRRKAKKQKRYGDPIRLLLTHGKSLIS